MSQKDPVYCPKTVDDGWKCLHVAGHEGPCFSSRGHCRKHRLVMVAVFDAFGATYPPRCVECDREKVDDLAERTNARIAAILEAVETLRARFYSLDKAGAKAIDAIEAELGDVWHNIKFLKAPLYVRTGYRLARVLQQLSTGLHARVHKAVDGAKK